MDGGDDEDGDDGVVASPRLQTHQLHQHVDQDTHLLQYRPQHDHQHAGDEHGDADQAVHQGHGDGHGEVEGGEGEAGGSFRQVWLFVRFPEHAGHLVTSICHL